MSATRKKQPITSKRVRMSEIIEEMTELSNAFAILRGSDDDLTTTIDEAIADVRAMIGDELTDDDEWIVAARPEQTRDGWNEAVGRGERRRETDDER
jgi:hypothetical protein